jgi:hypothetical protein
MLGKFKSLFYESDTPTVKEESPPAKVSVAKRIYLSLTTCAQ